MHQQKKLKVPLLHDLFAVDCLIIKTFIMSIMCSIFDVLRTRYCRFLNHEDPLINHSPWTTMEDKNLLYIIQQKGLVDWIDIAASLETNRTPFQCLARYQRSLNASILKREWTKEEDNQLRGAVEIYGESNWQVVASMMEGRTGTQCSNRSVNCSLNLNFKLLWTECMTAFALLLHAFPFGCYFLFLIVIMVICLIDTFI